MIGIHLRAPCKVLLAWLFSIHTIHHEKGCGLVPYGIDRVYPARLINNASREVQRANLLQISICHKIVISLCPRDVLLHSPHWTMYVRFTAMQPQGVSTRSYKPISPDNRTTARTPQGMIALPPKGTQQKHRGVSALASHCNKFLPAFAPLKPLWQF